LTEIIQSVIIKTYNAGLMLPGNLLGFYKCQFFLVSYKKLKSPDQQYNSLRWQILNSKNKTNTK